MRHVIVAHMCGADGSHMTHVYGVQCGDWRVAVSIEANSLTRTSVRSPPAHFLPDDIYSTARSTIALLEIFNKDLARVQPSALPHTSPAIPLRHLNAFIFNTETSIPRPHRMRQHALSPARSAYQAYSRAWNNESDTSAPPTRKSRMRQPSRRAPYRAARAFYLTLFLGLCLMTYTLLKEPHSISENRNYKRAEVHSQLNADQQCRLVHGAQDQCAWVHSQCPADEGGFTAYLDLYFCRLPRARVLAFAILVCWLGLLFATIGIAASDFFCINLNTIAKILGMSESMAGVTLLAFGNGSPDVFSTFAAMNSNSGSLAIGELFGAATFITAVVAGSMALIRPFKVAKKSFLRDVGFFVVAAGFSMVFLWDGKLLLWECLTMVAFYVFYVAFVFVWHWWLGRRRRRREKDIAARTHFVQGDDEFGVEEGERYHDDPDPESPRPTMSRGVSREDWTALERGDEVSPARGREEEEEEEEERDRWMSELNSKMRLTRSRTNTLTPVRPSLVGALEFQSVLKSLQKSGNIQTFPLIARRYSDDLTYTTAQNQSRMSNTLDPASRPPSEMDPEDDENPRLERNTHLDVPTAAHARGRAVSVNDATGLEIDPEIRRMSQDLNREHMSLIDEFESEQNSQREAGGLLQVPHRPDEIPTVPSPSLDILPAEDRPRRSATSSTSASRSPERLEVPEARSSSRRSPSPVPSARSLPRIDLSRRQRSHSPTPATSPCPRFQDESTAALSRPPSLYLPSALIASPETLPVSQCAEQELRRRPSFWARWWPHAVLPPPDVFWSVMFPTISRWHEKNHWDKALSLVAAPSVLLLTITLPVVEIEKEDEGSLEDDSFDSVRPAKTVSRPDLDVPLNSVEDLATAGTTGKGSSATVATRTEQVYRDSHAASSVEQTHSGHQNPSIVVEEGEHTISTAPKALPRSHGTHSPSDPINLSEATNKGPWNRWLLITQVFLAPLFIVLAVYSQSAADVPPQWLLRPTLVSLLVSLVLLIPLLLTTSPTHRPEYYRPILGLVGFVVSIAWISTIASQVVAALKALAVILNMSHAIMGLTIFAVGNSLGDLVADVTVAKLGYPVMALSACFGGPMLNILLGIGISGSYIIIRHANHRLDEHPDKHYKFKSYHIDISNTLIVSGGTLLVTLLALLVMVPMNKWAMDRKIGWVLISLWAASTIANVVLEVLGVGEVGQEHLGL